jgi:hypothetical protein
VRSLRKSETGRVRSQFPARLGWVTDDDCAFRPSAEDAVVTDMLSRAVEVLSLIPDSVDTVVDSLHAVLLKLVSGVCGRRCPKRFPLAFATIANFMVMHCRTVMRCQ